MQGIERNAVLHSAVASPYTGRWFALNGVDLIQYQVDSGTVEFYTTQDWDASAKAPQNWVLTKTSAGPAAESIDLNTRYGYFKVTAGGAVTIRMCRSYNTVPAVA